MTRYFTKVSDEVLDVIRDPDNLPRGLRLLGEIERAQPGWTLVEFEDDDAPPEMEGAEVEPTISVEHYKDGASRRLWISARTVVKGL